MLLFDNITLPSEKRDSMKEIELKLISELLKNNRRSDRELAKAMGVSQPTVSRLIKKLEKEGIIKEHTILPDFSKLGIELVAFVFGVWSPEKVKDYSEDQRVSKLEKFFSNHPNAFFASSGDGLAKSNIVISLHKNYSDYTQFMSQLKAEWAGLVDFESFIISFQEAPMPVPFSLRNLGKYIEKIM
jgi:DNA-binding Lrp family transcriptional regulator